ncbi:toxic anion resistance protein [Enterococcus cecorum]|uniref:Tellurite resistance protein n=2 Tax=Enterococcus cecorum TaxID=44008 RepID=S1RMB4_9ENTE|nr:toxic anion resistance protein [Enterococcus cecorum]EOX19115.1 tellurite resistance protein [Enterococcus cecorum DSM 20682 = ATCC 43198]ESK61155.1 tellurite resistance protein [Enterococcus cecorum DSM 20682 = ATCC 43198]KLN93283.1 tellurite resistance protein TelA [Enterococcus cecorum]KLN93314.1 tellurite resistance protein TelA [Enterococcus cecorum]KLO65435.1 tellurite resistance protein TelA [Enterococcus cecorum]
MDNLTPDTNKSLDDLLANPFSVDTNELTSSQQNEIKQFQEKQTAPRLIDRLDANYQEQAKQLASQIDVNDAQAVIIYGANAQSKLSEFSQSMLSHVQANDIGPIGDSLNELMYRLQEANPDELRAGEGNFFQRMFGKVKQSIYEITAKYQKIGAQIDKVAVKLEHEKDGLIKDNQMLEQMYQKNKDYFDALNIYIAAGELKIDELQNQIIPQAVAKAQDSGDQMDVQIVNDYTQFLDRLEKRTHDLRLTRQVTIQQAPQIRLIQNTNQVLAEKIQSSIHTAIPLWKNQVVIALTLLRQKDAVTAQRQVSETTNDLLKKNAELLKVSAIETAKENERGIIDIETLQKTQDDLIETIQETLRIQKEGKEKRQAAEIELGVMEENLKQKLLEITHS